MSNLFLVLFLISLILLIVGLIKPAMVIRWGKNRTRKRVALIFGIASLAFLILIGITAQPQPKTEPEQQIQDETPKIEEQQEEKGEAETKPSPSASEPEPQPEIQPEPEVQSQPEPEPQIEPVPEEKPQPEVQTTAVITYVIDGDTVKIGEQSVRLIGINTPESGQPYFSEARNKLIELVLNKTVTLEKDVSETDKYGRLLRYIYVSDTFVNLEMVKQGYANAWTYPPDVKYSDQLVAAERDARNAQIGLWKSAPESTGNITVSYMHADAEGNDNYNLNDEYVTFKNNGSATVDMTGWTVKDEATHIYTFSTFTLAPNATITLYTGIGTNTANKLYWGRKEGGAMAIWNNTGDTVYLRDVNGNLILEYKY